MPTLYTPESANRALPLVRRIVEDMVSAYARWRDLAREYELLAAGARPDRLDPRVDALQREIDARAHEIAGYERELDELGIRVPAGAHDRGLVDFPAELGGRPIYLCWQLGEQDVAFWHEPEGGFAGRQPIAPTAAA
ncbi:MAG TPA: DUF2203 domain-containing protein [Gemmatimonadaceae bacterium]|nr:DUF2203 domain-containing protein [Gemmatimonadaceae bacterium]